MFPPFRFRNSGLLFTSSAVVNKLTKLETQIQIRKTIKPSVPTPNHLRSLKLSLFDQLAPPVYSPLLFHYLPSSEWNRAKNTERCDKLEKSLAETLAKFYPLAGRYRKDDFSIQCNDEGVEYVETKVNVDLAEFIREEPEVEFLENLLPWRVPPRTDLSSSPLLGIQVNKFNCGGLVMGIQISHVLADAFTLGTFFNEWVHVSKTGTTKGCLPCFDQLSSLFPARVLSGPQFSLPSNMGAKIVTRSFVFDASALAKLKDRIEKSTRVVSVTALIWKVLTGISSAKHGHSRDSTLVFAMNMRGKTKLPSLEHALGNFCVAAFATLEANQTRKELNDFVNLVRSTSKDTSAHIGKASVEDITSMFVNYSPHGQKNETDIYLCSSLCRFPWYEADFGWGKPSWVNTISKNVEMISLIDTKNGEGIEARVSLNENDMAEFENDPDILTFCPPQKQHSIPRFGQK
ncbi:hypothetical protein K7X08_012103 [Anisodus acutangulus]|uniref:Uncharacterized protein n=1 Tax=Anisodus acutangulus TaxID=402998 RepID=A0A9Q1LDI3_9SOLA|nr:hypothetical protein K7X08_012103 [Anisodus acutangulus]